MKQREAETARTEAVEAGREAVEAAREAALAILARQLRPRRAVAERLAERGHARAAIEAALGRLEAVGLVDDLAYAEGFIRRRLRLRPRAPALLRRELRARGVPEGAIEAALAAFAGELDELGLARDVLRRQAYRWAKLDPAVARRRAAAALHRLGFSSAVIVRALSTRPERPA